MPTYGRVWGTAGHKKNVTTVTIGHWRVSVMFGVAEINDARGRGATVFEPGHGVVGTCPLSGFRKRPLAYRDPAVNRGPPYPAQAKSVSSPRPKGH